MIINDMLGNCIATAYLLHVKRGLLGKSVGLLLLLFVTACAEQQQLPLLPDDAVILAFGDSLTYGTGAKPGESYPAYLQKLLGLRVINAGIPGEMSASGVARFPSLLRQYQPDLVILCHGGNDILRKKDGAETAANLREMIEMAQSRNITVILLGVPKPGFFLKSARFYDALAAETGVYYLKDLVAEVLSDRQLKSDPIHPNNKGYARIAGAIDQSLRQAGAL